MDAITSVVFVVASMLYWTRYAKLCRQRDAARDERDELKRMLDHVLAEVNLPKRQKTAGPS